MIKWIKELFNKDEITYELKKNAIGRERIEQSDGIFFIVGYSSFDDNIKFIKVEKGKSHTLVPVGSRKYKKLKRFYESTK